MKRSAVLGVGLVGVLLFACSSDDRTAGSGLPAPTTVAPKPAASEASALTTQEDSEQVLMRQLRS